MAIKLTTTEDVLGNKRGVQVVPTVEDVFGILQKGFKNLINAYYGSYYFGVTQQATLALLGVADSIYSPKNLAEQAGLDISDPNKQITIFDFASGKLAENPRYGYFTAKVSDNSWDTSSANFTSILGPGMTEPRNGCEIGITCFFVDIAQNNGSNRLGGSANWSQDTKRWDIYPDNEVVIDNDTIIDVDGKIAVALDLINAQGSHSVILRTTNANTATGANDLVAGEGNAVSGNNNIVGGKGHAVPFSNGFAVGTFSQTDISVEAPLVNGDALVGVIGNGESANDKQNILAIFKSGYIHHHGRLEIDEAPRVNSHDVVRQTDLESAIDSLDSSVAKTGAAVLTGLTITNGKISASTQVDVVLLGSAQDSTDQVIYGVKTFDTALKSFNVPSANEDVVRKLELDTLSAYSDEEFVHKTADSLKLYGTATAGNKQQIQTTYAIATSTTAAEAGKIPQYRQVGNVGSIAAPTATVPVAEPTWEYDAANKRYADRNFLHIQEGTQAAPVILTDVIIGDANQQNGVRDLTVTGDLVVKGTQHTVDQETIQSQANLIVTNSSNAPLVGGTGVVSLAGDDFDYEAIALTAQTYVANKYYIKDASDNYILAEGAFDATETYYLRKAHSYAVAYYNATADAVQIGLGTYKNDEFTFDEAYSKVILTASTYQPDIYYTRTGEGTELSPYVYTLATGDFDASATYYSQFSEGQNVATRADSSFWFDHHLAEWDADAYTFIDSGLATDAVKSHLANTDNPHAVTKQQVGLGNVANERQYSAENPNLSSALPLMDGTASAGVATTYSHSDHVHPSDTAKVDKTTTIAGLDLSESRSAQALTDALIYCNTTTDIDYIMGD